MKKRSKYVIGFVTFISVAIIFQNCGTQRKFVSQLDGVSPDSSQIINLSSTLKGNYTDSTFNSNSFKFRTGQIVGYSIGFSPLITLATGSFFDHIGIIGVDSNGIPYLYNSEHIGWIKVPLSSAYMNIPKAIVEDPMIRSNPAKQKEIFEILEKLVAIGKGRYDYASFYPSQIDLEKSVRKACSHFVSYAFSLLDLPSSNSFGYGLTQKVFELANLTQAIPADGVGSVSDQLFRKYLLSAPHAVYENSMYQSSPSVMTQLLRTQDFSDTPWPDNRIKESKNFFVITPDSIMNDPRLEILYSDVPMGGRYYSEAEIFYAMKSRLANPDYNKSEFNFVQKNLSKLSTKSLNKYPNFLRQAEYTPPGWKWNTPSMMTITCPAESESMSLFTCDASIVNSSNYTLNWKFNGEEKFGCKDHYSSCSFGLLAGKYLIQAVLSSNDSIIAESNIVEVTIKSQASTPIIEGSVKDGNIPAANAGFTYLGNAQFKNRENGLCLLWSETSDYGTAVDCTQTSTIFAVYSFDDNTYMLCKPGTLRYEGTSISATYIAKCIRYGTVTSNGTPRLLKLQSTRISIWHSDSKTLAKDYPNSISAAAYFKYQNELLYRDTTDFHPLTQRRQTPEVREELHTEQLNQKWELITGNNIAKGSIKSNAVCPSGFTGVNSSVNNTGKFNTCNFTWNNTKYDPTNPVITYAGNTAGSVFEAVCGFDGRWVNMKFKCPAPANETLVNTVQCPGDTQSVASSPNNAGKTNSCTFTWSNTIYDKSNPSKINYVKGNTTNSTLEGVCGADGKWKNVKVYCPAPANEVVSTNTVCSSGSQTVTSSPNNIGKTNSCTFTWSNTNYDKSNPSKITYVKGNTTNSTLEGVCGADGKWKNVKIYCPAPANEVVATNTVCSSGSQTVTSIPNSIGKTNSCTFTWSNTNYDKSNPNKSTSGKGNITNSTIEGVCGADGKWKNVKVYCPAPK